MKEMRERAMAEHDAAIAKYVVAGTLSIHQENQKKLKLTYLDLACLSLK
jgi:hypothetical protein